MNNSRVFIAGHRGLVGSAVHRLLVANGYTNLFIEDKAKLNLLDDGKVLDYLVSNKIEYVFVCAARVGGIIANSSYPFDFIYENLKIQNSIIHGSYKAGVKKLLFLGSSCIYPKHANCPIKEEALLSGYLEPTNDAYAIAKIAGIKLCESLNKQYGMDYIAAMPTNLYGINDNFNLKTSHVIPALIAKFSKAKHDKAKSLTLLGTGKPLREFLYVDDLAKALLFLMQSFSYKESGDAFINVGSPFEISIKDLAGEIAGIIGYGGEIIFDATKPDGTMRKKLCLDKIERLGFSPTTTLSAGLEKTIAWYKASGINSKF